MHLLLEELKHISLERILEFPDDGFATALEAGKRRLLRMLITEGAELL